MKGFKSTSTNPYTYTQSGVWKKGQYTFQAIVLSDSGYAIAFQKPDLSWDVIDLSWQVQAGQYCSVLEAGFTLEYDAVAFKLIANAVTGEVIVLSPMLEKGGNPSTPIAHEEDLRGMDGDNHEFIFTRNDTGIAPPTPLSTQENDHIPIDDSVEPPVIWTDNPQGVTKELPFEFVSMREKKNGVWLNFSPPSLWAKWAEDGFNVKLHLQGHYVSHWEGTTKVTEIVGGEIINDSEVVKITAKIRKGEKDVTADELLSRGFIWYANGVEVARDVPFITLDETYGDGFADYVVLSYLVNSLREEEQVEVLNISAGMDGIGEEFIFKANNSETEPPVLPQTTDTNYQDDDYYGQGTANEWSDDPVSPTEANQFVWTAKRKKVGGIWEAFGTPSVWTRWVTDGGDAAYWELHSSAPLIYKDAEDASTSGVHTTITLSGRYVKGVSSQNGGYISVQPNGGVEDTPLISPREFTPPNNAGVDEYVIRLYDDDSKATLLDTLTVPIAFKGDKGVSAINIILSNESDALPASPEGVVSDYSGSGTTIRVFEGNQELSYGTGNGKYQVVATGSNISPDSIPTTNGNARVYGNASNMGANATAVITFTVSGKTFGGESFSFDKVQNFTKSERGDTGASAPLLYLSASAQVMKCNPNNTPQTGQTISIEAKLQNVSGTATFVATPYNDAGTALTAITLGGTGNTRTITNAQWLATYKRIEVVATLGSLTDKVTIHRLADGATGENVIVGFLTNENITLQANSAGVVSSFTSANGEFWVYDGTTKVTSGITFSKVSQTGCTAAITSAGVYSVSAMSADNATVVLRAVYRGVTIDKVLTLSKSKAGADGEDGITIIPNQQGYTYRADLNGDIIGSLANGMVELTIMNGSTPITCSSISGGVPTTNGTYRVTRTLGNGITTNQSLSDGKYRITPATLTVDEASVNLDIKIMMGGGVTSYPLILTYRKQFDGADGKSTEFIFKGHTSDNTAPTLPSTSQQDDWYGQGTANEWNDDLVEPTKSLPYVWASQRKKVDGVWGAFTTPKVWLRYAEDGDGIVSTTIEYAKSSSGTAIPETWSTSLPTPTKGWYLWTRTTTEYKKSPTTVSYSISYWAEDGDPGENGDSVVHIYRHSLLKPATPTSGAANPTGWANSPDKGVSTPIPTNWTLKDKWYQSEELTALGTTSISVISFTTTLPNQVVALELWADGHTTYDYIYAGKLNIGVTTSNYYDRVVGGKKTITYDVPNAGSHSIQIMWRKGIATIVGSNRGYFAIIKNVKVWRSTTAIINNIYQSWSSPEEFYPDSSTEETIYCLSKTETPPLISDSDAYIDEYIPLPCAVASYRGDFSTSRAYAIAQVVVYSGEYYKIIKAVPSNYSGNPTNTEYFENIKGWTDNAKGATAEFPFEYRSKRKKSEGAWVAFSTSTVDGRWVEDGEDAADIRLTATNTQAVIGTNGVTPTEIIVTGTAKNTTISGWSYSVDGGSFTTPPNGVTRASNVVTINTAVAVWRTLAIKAYNTTDNVDSVITISIVGYGAAGEKGKVPIVKEWLYDSVTPANSDTHLNNENVVDFIYYRPTRTWWKLKDEYTSRLATSSPSTTYYEQIPYMGALAAKVLIAEEANLANFIFKGGQLLSIAGTVGGSPAVYTGQAGFVHNIVLDGESGTVTVRDGVFNGKVTSSSDGNRVTIDPVDKSIKLIDSNDETLSNIGFKKITEGSQTFNQPYIEQLSPSAYSFTPKSFFRPAYIELTNVTGFHNTSFVFDAKNSQIILGLSGSSPSLITKIEISPSNLKITDDSSNTCELRVDGMYINGVKFTGSGGGYVHPSTHPASMISAGTLQGIVKANNNTSYTTKQVRNMILSTGNADASSMANGDIWIKYE